MAPIALKSTDLAEQLSSILATEIVNGKYPLGSRLPTEEKLSTDFRVSRSVVREAVARMKSDGLVTTRQGLGAFVAESFASVPFRFPVISEDSQKEVLEVFEFRLGVEAQAAALAAERATAAQLGEIYAALRAVEVAHSAGIGVDQDLRFHRAIAQAANNRIYNKFITFLELHIRDQLDISLDKSKANERLPTINAEHEAIYEAIRSRDPDAAHNAVVTHLRNGMERICK
jgi:GntR family transcriptional repressor for pyruvate dehydrogenase complex